jgi:hypothetical protein
MKRLCIGFGISVALLMVMTGCGGNGSGFDSGNRAEGNIPIGRIKGVAASGVEIKAVYAGGETYTASVTSTGLIYMEPLPYGTMDLNVVPTSGDLASNVYRIQMSPQQRYIINVEMEPKKSSAVVRSIALEIPNNRDVVVGKTYPIKITIDGDNIGSLKPTLWLDGGVGSLDSGNRFVALATGEAVIHAELLGVEGTLTIPVN